MASRKSAMVVGFVAGAVTLVFLGGTFVLAVVAAVVGMVAYFLARGL